MDATTLDHAWHGNFPFAPNSTFLHDPSPDEQVFIDYPGTSFDFDDLLNPDAYEEPVHAPICRQNAPPPRLDTQVVFFEQKNFQLSPQSDLPHLNVVPSFSPTASDNGSTGNSTIPRTPSKRARNAADASTQKVQQPKRARNKRIESGYPCTAPTCEQCFDTAGELNKHQKRAHTSRNSRPHQCHLCVMRFFWPKDVRRHLEQSHAIKRIKPATAFDSISVGASEPQSPTSRTPNIMKSLAQSLLVLKKLRIRSKSADDHVVCDEKVIMVTQDKRTWVDVDLTGITQAGSLIRKIALELAGNRSVEPQKAHVYTYSRASGVGRPLTKEALLALVTKKADAQGSLRLYLEMCPIAPWKVEESS